MHRVKWATPAPQWPSAAAIADADSRSTVLQRPMLLRFATDSFMQDLAAILDDDPERLKEIEARPGETWREYPGALSLPSAGATLLSTPERRKLGARFKMSREGKAKEAGKPAPKKVGATPPEPPAIKLFQPSHQRYYLVAASLVCGFPGLPDHRVDPAKQERVSFVVRRLVPRDPDAKTFDPDPTKIDEYAFVTGEEGSAWVPAPRQAGSLPAIVPGEEKLPMFGSPFVGADGVPRRLFTGLVPVSRREVYMGTPQRQPAPSPLAEDDAATIGAFPEPVDARVVMLIDDVIGPWRSLRAEVGKLNANLKKAATAAEDKKEPLNLALHMRDRILQTSWLLLLDFATFLRRYLPEVSAAIDRQSPSGLTTPAEVALYTALTKVAYEADDRPGTHKKITLAQMLAGFDSAEHRDLLDKGPTLLTDDTRREFGGLPRFAFCAIRWPNVQHEDLDDRRFDESFTFNDEEDKDDVDKDLKEKLARLPAAPTAIKKAVEAVLKERAPDASVPPPPPAAQATLPPNRTTRFVLRCVFDRPHCGAFAPSIVSEQTEPFAMAPFFDPDAPMRQVRIAMPIDTSPAGLRKYQKNASFLISDVLCGQMGAARSLTLGDLVLYVLPWPFHKDLPEPEVKACSDLGLGMICSLSIPIVTVCAIILLIIIVTILDHFFRWLPWLITCFPFPLKAKEQD